MSNASSHSKTHNVLMVWLFIIGLVALVGWGKVASFYFFPSAQETGVTMDINSQTSSAADAAPPADFTSSAVSSSASAADGISVMTALERRHSVASNELAGRKLEAEKITALAWAATGKNRAGSGFVVPMAMGADPYVSIYVADDGGVSRFDWSTNKLVPVATGDVRASLVTQGFAQAAPQLMIFVIEKALLPSANLDFGYTAVGAMSQNVYLLAEELGVQTRYLASINAAQITQKLQLGSDQLPVGAMVLAEGE
jgi:hypothetical protein